uniref:Uncharacterized protein n=1 Tax=Cucumis melo TaxID=3656 RepID=A0A9I9EGE0_CUCME
MFPPPSDGPYEGGKQDATLSFKDEDFVKIALGKMNPQIASLRNSRRNAAHLQRHRNQFLLYLLEEETIRLFSQSSGIERLLALNIRWSRDLYHIEDKSYNLEHLEY